VSTENVRVGPADVTPGSRAKLEAIAGWLQDIAFHDIVEVGLDDAGFWIVRRTRIRVERFPRFSETLELRTACTGASHALAERRTSIAGDGGGRVEAVSVWVNVDPETQVPARLSPRFFEVYGPQEGARPRSRLRHPSPSASAGREPWSFRRGDLDVVGHVNNTRYWAVADELLVGDAAQVPVDIEVEHRAAAPVGDSVVRRDGDMAWITGLEGEVFASAMRLG